MESVFPEVLFLSFFAPLILRIAVAVAFFAIAGVFWKHKNELAETQFPIIGKPGKTLIGIKIIFTALVGLAFLVGFYVQIAAILGFFGALKQWYFSKKYPTLFPFNGFGYFLLAFISLALFFTGAGALAIDLPY